MTDITTQVRELLELEKKATPGECRVVHDGSGLTIASVNPGSRNRIVIDALDDEGLAAHLSSNAAEGNAQLIAAARNLARPLAEAYLALVESLSSSQAACARNADALCGAHEEIKRLKEAVSKETVSSRSLAERVEELERENARLKAALESPDIRPRTNALVNQLFEDRDRLREALEFYADTANYGHVGAAYEYPNWYTGTIEKGDRGERAREALQKK